MRRFNAEADKRHGRTVTPPSTTPWWVATADPLADYRRVVMSGTTPPVPLASVPAEGIITADDIEDAHMPTPPTVPPGDLAATLGMPAEQVETEAAVRRLLPLMRRAGASPVDVYDERAARGVFVAECTIPAGRARRTVSGEGGSPLEAFQQLADAVRAAIPKRPKGKRR